jgi:hypothetical protein
MIRHPAPEPTGVSHRLIVVKLALLISLAVLTTACSSGDPSSGRPHVTQETTDHASGPAASVDPSGWAEHWDCGRTFQLSNVEQTSALVVEPLGVDVFVDTLAVQLPSPSWRVRVQLGSDLFARGFTADHACTDVLNDGDPLPGIDEEWEAIAGSLFIDVGAEPGWRKSARLVAADLIVQGPGGEAVVVGDVSGESQCWGCAAG